MMLARWSEVPAFAVVTDIVTVSRSVTAVCEAPARLTEQPNEPGGGIGGPRGAGGAWGRCLDSPGLRGVG